MILKILVMVGLILIGMNLGKILPKLIYYCIFGKYDEDEKRAK